MKIISRSIKEKFPNYMYSKISKALHTLNISLATSMLGILPISEKLFL